MPTLHKRMQAELARHRNVLPQIRKENRIEYAGMTTVKTGLFRGVFFEKTWVVSQYLLCGTKAADTDIVHLCIIRKKWLTTFK